MMTITWLLLAAMFVDPGPGPSEGELRSAAEYSASKNGRSVVVMFDGKVVFEKYSLGGSVGSAQMLASGSKSFVGVAAMAAVEDGLIQLDDPASEALAEWRADPRKSRITYRQLLNLTSGLTAGGRAMAIRCPSWKAILDNPTVGTPGGQFGYGAHHLNAFAAALERKLGNETFEAYLKRRILDPLGIKLEWRGRCEDGHPQVGGGGFMTARDWATFGEFIRQKGGWRGKQIISRDLLKECFRGTSPNPAYGLTWWLKKPVTEAQLRRITVLASEWGDMANSRALPDDLVAACGAGKQRLYVIPSRKLVIVRQGGLSSGFSDVEFLCRLLGRDAKSSEPGPSAPDGHREGGNR